MAGRGPSGIDEGEKRWHRYAYLAIALLLAPIFVGGGIVPFSVMGILGTVVVVVLLSELLYRFMHRTSDGLIRMLTAQGEMENVPTFSFEEALIAQGKFKEADEALAQRAANEPDEPEVRIRRADLYERHLKDPLRASRFYLEAQGLGLPAKRDVYVALALADIYRARGATAQLRRELARVVERYPDSAQARRARDELRSLAS